MPVQFRDYYQVLGISPQATAEEIKKAFRSLARKYHPDVAKDKKTAEEKFKELNEAHEVLSHPESRRKYDVLGAGWKAGAGARPDTGGGAGTDRSGTSAEDIRFEGTGFSDFFEQFFAGRGGGFRRAGGFEGGGPVEGDAVRGPDIRGEIFITLEEVLAGARRTISVRRTRTDTGQEVVEAHPVRIPAGVQAGQSIRVPGKGGEGLGGGGAGDIYLRVRYGEHPDWHPRGADLVGELDLAPWEAVLGATVPVRTLDSTVSVKVPPGTCQGQQLRIRGQGLPAGKDRRGDLYVVIVVQVPREVGKEEEVLWRELAGKSTFDPRKVS